VVGALAKYSTWSVRCKFNGHTKEKCNKHTAKKTEKCARKKQNHPNPVLHIGSKQLTIQIANSIETKT
jgi:hypothetical protein